MSDSRNSSGNVRGGGAKQTGGSGRTTRGGNSKGGPTLGLGDEKKNDRNEATRNLQLRIMSKELAIEMRAAALEHQTEAEYKEMKIPMPDPASAMKKLKAMGEFTMDWYDKDFRKEWLKKTRALWEEELRNEYRTAYAAVRTRDAKKAANAAAAASGVGGSTGTETTENEAMSIEELEAAILSLDISTEERKKLKNKLKKKRQKAKKKDQQDGNDRAS